METEQQGSSLYLEEQKFRQPLIWAIIIAVMFFSFLSVGQVFYAALTKDAANLPQEYRTKVVTMLGVALLNATALLLFLTAKLSIEVRASGLYIKFFPFHRKWQKLPLEGVVGSEHVTYSPIVDYGGWGIRYGLKKKAYNISGKKGVRINYRDDNHILIGSQNGDQLQAAIESIRR